MTSTQDTEPTRLAYAAFAWLCGAITIAWVTAIAWGIGIIPNPGPPLGWVAVGVILAAWAWYRTGGDR